MKNSACFLLCCLFIYGCSSTKEMQTPGHYGEYTLLPNGWRLTPAGENIPIGELPLNLLLTDDGKYAITSNSGAGEHSISVTNLETLKETQRLLIDKTWRGLCFNRDGSVLYVSGGNNDNIYSFDFRNGMLARRDSFSLRIDPKEKISVSGTAYLKSKNLLLAVSKGTNSFYVYDPAGRTMLKTVQMDSECYDVITDNNERYAYVSQWGNSSVAKIDIETMQVVKKIKTGDHPCEMIITKNDKWLYVTNANNNSTSLIDLEAGEEREKLISSLKTDAPYGSTPNSIALNEDETVLFIANADNNYLALFDVSEPLQAKSIGFIPVAWYPTAVRYSPALNKILVANGKGLASAPNPEGPMPGEERENTIEQYIGTLFKGTLSVIDYPEQDELAAYTQQVFKNTPYMQDKAEYNQNVFSTVFDSRRSSKIKHVFYVIKENRTYDQVFGDMPEGNGDPSICLFPEEVTPNQHRLAREFTLFDNFYVNAEVSADGHNWSTAAYATDYVEKTWPTYYGGRGGQYDFEAGKEITFPSSGYIWDQVIEKKLGFRNYGEFTNETSRGSGKYQSSIERMNEHTCDFFPGWDMKIPDRERYNRWQKDFNMFAEKDSLPAFHIIRLPNNHTAGTSKGFPTVKAMIADNDYAVGQLVETISKSRYWKESIIFILEDDAQNGSDHVDAHRSPLLVISPYVKRNYVDHTMYSTSSVLKTMELILGLDPMTQFDLSAAAITSCIQDEPDFTSYTSIKPEIDMDEMNTASMYGSDRSGQMDLTKEDAIPDIEFNEIIWKSIKGVDSKMPVPVRSAYLMIKEEEDDDDD